MGIENGRHTRKYDAHWKESTIPSYLRMIFFDSQLPKS
ncbi:hypothetical protein CPTD_00545 [Corynebacterium pseudotuberculosis]|nr:hypothetical protein CPTA_00975 [Corynebacterium pseudotuberculosis]AIG08614.1 hypothetical protein CPTB_00558 [Corynebacterium pseudotuberculosis]AIG10506.1 hypothetical protein CPTC_00218 [Corynebacterium pseudotuberculosis]ATQ64763.1 Hypothetical protein CpPA07_0444 [Corynebacterium pseudotuberculosis]KEX88807.1 hypothetical protein CPTD_00545 [Corynebacterium pseudotuberculosis]